MSKVSAALSKAGWNQHKLYAKTVWIFKWGHLTSFNLPALNLLNQLASFLPHCSCCPFTLLCFPALSTSHLYYILPLSSPFSIIKYFSSLLRHLQPWSFARFSYTLDFFLTLSCLLEQSNNTASSSCSSLWTSSSPASDGISYSFHLLSFIFIPFPEFTRHIFCLNCLLFTNLSTSPLNAFFHYPSFFKYSKHSWVIEMMTLTHHSHALPPPLLPEQHKDV